MLQIIDENHDNKKKDSLHKSTNENNSNKRKDDLDKSVLQNNNRKKDVWIKEEKILIKYAQMQQMKIIKPKILIHGTEEV
jgi:hypothetical protein